MAFTDPVTELTDDGWTFTTGTTPEGLTEIVATHPNKPRLSMTGSADMTEELIRHRIANLIRGRDGLPALPTAEEQAIKDRIDEHNAWIASL